MASLHDGFTDQRVSIGAIVDVLRERGFAAVLLLLSAIELLPVPIAIWDVLSATVALLCFARVVRGGTIALPAWLRRRTISRPTLQRACRATLPWIRRLETTARPRLSALARPRDERVLALASGLLAGLLVLPVPVVSWLPAIALFLVALGWFAADGLFVLAGLLVGVVSFAAYGALVFGLLDLGGLLS